LVHPPPHKAHHARHSHTKHHRAHPNTRHAHQPAAAGSDEHSCGGLRAIALDVRRTPMTSRATRCGMHTWRPLSARERDGTAKGAATAQVEGHGRPWKVKWKAMEGHGKGHGRSSGKSSGRPASHEACLHTCLPSHLPSHLPAFTPAVTPACLHTCLPSHLPAFTPACLHTCRHTCTSHEACKDCERGW